MIKPSQSKISDLIKRAMFRAVLRTELHGDASIITERYVLAKKSEDDKKEKYEAKYFAEGHLEIMKDTLVRRAQAIQYVPARHILVIEKGNDSVYGLWMIHSHVCNTISQ